MLSHHCHYGKNRKEKGQRGQGESWFCKVVRSRLECVSTMMVERWKEWGVWVQGAALQAEAPAGTALTIYRREGTKPKVVWLKAATVVYFAPDSAIWAGLHGTCKSLLGIWSAEVTHGEGSLGSLAQGQLQVAVIKQCIFMFVYISFHRVVGGGRRDEGYMDGQ